MSGVIRYWNYVTQQCLFTIDERRSSGQTLGFALNFTEDVMITFGADNVIYVYDVMTKARIAQLQHR